MSISELWDENIFCRLAAFNKWLNDVYDEEMNFNTLLVETGFSEVEIEYLKREYLSEFFQELLHLIASYPDLAHEERNSLMLIHYGLIDGKPQALATIGASVGVSPERIRQLVNKRMDLYRDPKRKAKFQSDFASIGRRLLNGKRGIQD